VYEIYNTCQLAILPSICYAWLTPEKNVSVQGYPKCDVMSL